MGFFLELLCAFFAFAIWLPLNGDRSRRSGVDYRSQFFCSRFCFEGNLANSTQDGRNLTSETDRESGLPIGVEGSKDKQFRGRRILANRSAPQGKCIHEEDDLRQDEASRILVRRP